MRFVRFNIVGQTFFILGIVLSVLSNSSFAQAIIYDEFPIDAQIYQRDDLNRGTVTIKGRLYTEGYTDVSVVGKKDKKDFYWKKQKLTFQPGDLLNAPFSFQPIITSGLVEYEFYFYAHRGQDSVLVKNATQLVCGDIIVIYGQSNAEANDSNELAKFKDEFKYGRVAFVDLQTGVCSWFPTLKWNYYMAGLVGLEIQKQLIERYKIPIGVINGAVGNKSIDDLMIRNEKNHEDAQYYYGQLLKKAKLNRNARIFIWRQGESEAFDATRVDAYPAKFAQLRKQIHEDFTAIKKIYVFQNNIYWVDNPKAGELRDFQRKVGQLYPDCEGFTTIGTPGFDGLHYSFEGYKANGDELSRLIAKDFFNSTDTLEVHSPDIKKAYFTDNRDSLVLEFDKNQKMQYPGYSIDKNNGGKAFFNDYIYLDGVAGKVVGGKSEGNKIILRLSEPSNAKYVTYSPDNFSFNAESLIGIPYLQNSRGLRAFTFKNFPVSLHVKTAKPVLAGKLVNGVLRRVSLEWVAQANLTYTVEKSVGNTENFVKITDQAQGAFIDLKIKKGIKYYYRLNIDDEVFSNIIEISVPFELNGILENEDVMMVYPNPVHNGDELRINMQTPATELVLSTSQGNVIQRIPVNTENITISTSKLNPGIYLLEAVGKDSKKTIKKIVVD